MKGSWTISAVSFSAGLSYTGSKIIHVHETKEQSEHNNTLLARPNRNNNDSFALRHFSPVNESLPVIADSSVLETTSIAPQYVSLVVPLRAIWNASLLSLFTARTC